MLVPSNKANDTMDDQLFTLTLLDGSQVKIKTLCGEPAGKNLHVFCPCSVPQREVASFLVSKGGRCGRPKQGNDTMDEQLFTPTQLNDYLLSVTERWASVMAFAPDFLKEWHASGRRAAHHQRDLAQLRTRLETPMEARLEGDLRYWLTSPHCDADLKPWCEVALGWLLEGEFRAAMGVLWLMEKHLGSVPATLNADEDEWADYTARRADGPSEAVREIALKRVMSHPLYRTQEEIAASWDAEAARMMAEMDADDDRTTAEMIADFNAKMADIFASV